MHYNNNITGVIDNVNTYTMKQAYEALDANINTIQAYLQNLLNKNANKQDEN